VRVRNERQDGLATEKEKENEKERETATDGGTEHESALSRRSLPL
jgi:hypothetical protein